MKITYDRFVSIMSAKNKPAAVVKPGDTVVFETRDCFGSQYKHGNEDESDIDKSLINPATGPLYIDGAEPGDCLKVTIVDIKLVGKAQMEKRFFFEITDGLLIFDGKTTIPINPMVGVIGTAPPVGVDVPTHTPGMHGGNMDCTMITAGALVYLPVNVPGALLAMGDLHAVMGDGEVCGYGAEIAGEVTVRVDIIKGFKHPLPLVEKDGVVAAVASADTLDEACRLAVENMAEYLVNIGYSKDKAMLLLSLKGDLGVCQIVNPLKTARMEFMV
ncbi:MAG: acetamidase/formamidase family protein [Defluviitaleaceae bacterium]|nr:acetamidase/formamidase family protein [Defluviitaleaceae bacterium]